MNTMSMSEIMDKLSKQTSGFVRAGLSKEALRLLKPLRPGEIITLPPPSPASSDPPSREVVPLPEIFIDVAGDLATVEGNKEAIRENICSLERVMKSFYQDEQLTEGSCPLKHTFVPGAYIREITMPAGLLIIGKIHKHEHFNFITRGEVSVITEDGGYERLTGPLSIVSPAGTKRVVFTHTETVWTTMHITNETDLEKIEEETIAESYKSIGLWDPVEVKGEISG